MTKYILALDQGSTSSRAIVFDPYGRVHAQAQVKLPTRCPKPGWVEHDPRQLLTGQISAVNRAINQLGSQKKGIIALGIANQRSTLLLWERQSGRPLTPAISWQDHRAAELCKSLADHKTTELIRQKTGLRLTPYYAAPKLAWQLEHIPQARKRAEQGDLLCGTVNSYLIWHLTRGQAHLTDHTNAARMLLMDLSTFYWDHELVNLFGIPSQILPRIVCTSQYQGTARIGRNEIPIFCSIGDQKAASIGLGCIKQG